MSESETGSESATAKRKKHRKQLASADDFPEDHWKEPSDDDNVFLSKPKIRAPPAPPAAGPSAASSKKKLTGPPIPQNDSSSSEESDEESEDSAMEQSEDGDTGEAGAPEDQMDEELDVNPLSGGLEEMAIDPDLPKPKQKTAKKAPKSNKKDTPPPRSPSPEIPPPEEPPPPTKKDKGKKKKETPVSEAEMQEGLALTTPKKKKEYFPLVFSPLRDEIPTWVTSTRNAPSIFWCNHMETQQQNGFPTHGTTKFKELVDIHFRTKFPLAVSVSTALAGDKLELMKAGIKELLDGRKVIIGTPSEKHKWAIACVNTLEDQRLLLDQRMVYNSSIPTLMVFRPIETNAITVRVVKATTYLKAAKDGPNIPRDQLIRTMKEGVNELWPNPLVSKEQIYKHG